MNKTFLKSVGAVLLGIIVIFITSIGTDMLLEKIGVFPPIGDTTYTRGMLLFALLYRCLYGILGSYITAKVAPQRPMFHALILGSVGVILSTFGTIVGWDLSAHWYPIALIISSLPCAWLGGFLYSKK